MSNTSTTPAPAAASATPSQDIVGQKFDRCLADHIVKAGLGFSAGVVLSVILFKRRAWPISLGTGFGLGMAYADCDRAFNPARVPGMRLQTGAPTTQKPASA
ncbi:DUF543-domain-containing protein [Auricularia subglabra TFB-10046 SS5]|nr:DUF543-domain-containing protein [Auricularia subglabra TFB-10046 SS5]